MKFQGILLTALLGNALAFTALGPSKKYDGLRETTALKNGMDAYDAQMKAMSGGGVAQLTKPSAPPMASSNKLSARFRKKTKQLATLGPASSSFEMIEKLFLAGADIFRLNFSHGEHAQKKELLDIIRQVEAKYDHPIAILGDLQGPKLRVGTFDNSNGELLLAGQAFRFDLDNTPGNNQRVMLPHPEIIEASEVGHSLLIDDGKMRLTVVGTGPGYLDCVVDVAGRIKDRKVGIQLYMIVRVPLFAHLSFSIVRE
jgi:pyruvate kinase